MTKKSTKGGSPGAIARGHFFRKSGGNFPGSRKYFYYFYQKLPLVSFTKLYTTGMGNKLLPELLPKGSPHQGLKLFLAIVFILGIFFRFVNLDRKVYWQDEAATSLRISGYSKIEFVQEVYNGQPITVGQLRERYQSPNQSKNLGDTLQVLMAKAEHPPLYYLMARFWAQIFGGSVTSMRSLPAFISLLAFPAMYWLCQELFATALVSRMAIALIAVSPVHVLYAQEARQYSLWMVIILLSSAALLRAMRQKNIGSWAIYGITLVLGCYTHLFFALIALGHGIYLLGLAGIKLNKIVRDYLVTSGVGLLVVAPWIWVFIQYKNNSHYFHSITTALSRKIPVAELMGKWFRSVNRFFHDADLGTANIILVLLGAYSLYFIYRHTNKRIWWFVFTLFGITALTLGLPDLISGGQRSVRTRYLIPCGLALELSMAYLFTIKLTQFTKVWQQRVWQFVLVLLISAGVISNIVSSQAESWWNKNQAETKYYPRIAEVINQGINSLVISDTSETNILALSYLLHPQVKLRLVSEGDWSNLAVQSQNQTVFVFDGPEALINHLQREKNLTLNRVFEQKIAQLWQIN